MLDLHTIPEMFARLEGCLAYEDRRSLRAVKEGNIGCGRPPARGRDMAHKRAYERERLKDPILREREIQRKRNARALKKAAG